MQIPVAVQSDGEEEEAGTLSPPDLSPQQSPPQSLSNRDASASYDAEDSDDLQRRGLTRRHRLRPRRQLRPRRMGQYLLQQGSGGRNTSQDGSEYEEELDEQEEEEEEEEWTASPSKRARRRRDRRRRTGGSGGGGSSRWQATSASSSSRSRSHRGSKKISRAAAADEPDEVCVTKVEPACILPRPAVAPVTQSASTADLSLPAPVASAMDVSTALAPPATAALPLSSFAIPAQLQTPQGLVTVNLLIAPSSMQQQQPPPPPPPQQLQSTLPLLATTPTLPAVQQLQLLQQQQSLLQQYQQQPTIAQVQSVPSVAATIPAATSSAPTVVGMPTKAKQHTSAVKRSAANAGNSYRTEKAMLYNNLLRMFEKARNRGGRLLAELRQLRRCISANEALIDRLTEFVSSLGNETGGGAVKLDSATSARLLSLLSEARESLTAQSVASPSLSASAPADTTG